jgi:ribosomal protein S12 methylthiotransferase accessory factor
MSQIERKRSMEIRLGEGKKVSALYAGFEILTDQSVKSGGEATAPEPFDLFLASLGTCAGYYVASFCATRDIPTEGISLAQSWTRGDKGRLETVRLEIRVPPDFPEKYRPALARAAGRCSVKRTLEAPPAVETDVIVSG